MQRVAIVGYGTVAGVHAAQLRKTEAADIVSVCGPDASKAAAFAEAHAISHAETDLARALDGCDAAIVCSPSSHHYGQALEALKRTSAVLVELPACSTEQEAVVLAEAADRAGARLHCAHTSRYLRPFRTALDWIRDRLDDIVQVNYARSVPPRNRSWTDDALLHHAAHPLDLLQSWFGDLSPVAFRGWPPGGPPQAAAVLAELPNGVPVSVTISYIARTSAARLTLTGLRQTVETDGFSFVAGDGAPRTMQFDSDGEYEDAIARQDAEFLAGAGVPWSDTVQLMRLLDRLRASDRIRA